MASSEGTPERISASLQCIGVVFEKFIEKNSFGQLIYVLKTNKAISQGQHKNIKKATKKKEDYEKAFQKLFDALGRNQLANFAHSLRDDNFPCSGEVKQLLEAICEKQHEGLIFLLQNWDVLEKNQADLKNKPFFELLLHKEDITDSLVKRFLIAVAKKSSEETNEDTEHPIIKEVVTYVRELVAEDKAEMPKELKRPRVEEQDGDIKQPQEADEKPPTVDKQPAAKKKKKAIPDKKNRRSHKKKKKKSDPGKGDGDEQKKNVNQPLKEKKVFGPPDDENIPQTLFFGVQSVIPLPGSSSQRTSTIGKGDGDEQKKNVNQPLKEEKVFGPPDDENIPQPLFFGVQSVIPLPGSSSQRTSTIDNNAEKEVGDNMESMEVESPVNEAKTGIVNNNDNAKAKSSQVKSQDNNAEKEVGDNMESMEVESPGTNRSYAEVASGSRDGMTTRSQSATGVKGEKGVCQRVLRSAEECSMQQQNELCSIEFRAVLDNLRLDTPLLIIMSCFDWKPKQMEFDQERGYYVKKFFFDKEHHGSGIVEYKFCYETQDEFSYEVLPPYRHSGNINRKINLAAVKTSKTLCLNVCVFNSSWEWIEKCYKSMGRFSPEPKILDSEDDRIAFAFELYSWINCMKDGWKTSNQHYVFHDWAFEQILIDWLKKLEESTTYDTEGIKFRVFACLVVANALASRQHSIVLGELLMLLFQFLRIDKMSTDDCMNVFNNAMEAFNAAGNIGLELPSYREAILGLYKRIPNKPNFEWILTLPLYWLMLHGEVKNQVFSSKAKLLTLREASLPTISDFDWLSKVQRPCFSAERTELLEMSQTIIDASQLHPWIIGTFQFMLSSAEFQSLILNKEKIVMLFPVDSTLQQYLDWFLKGYFSNMTDIQNESVDAYFRTRIDDLIIMASEPEQMECKKESLISTCLNLLETVYMYMNGKQREFRQNMLWCLDIVLLKSATLALLLEWDDKNHKNLEKVLNQVLSLVTKRIYQHTVNKSEVQYWGKLLKAEWDLKWFSERWNELIVHEIQNALNNHCRTESKDGAEKFIYLYAGTLGELEMHMDVEKCLNDKAYKCIEELLKKQEKHWIKKFAEKIFQASFAPTSRLIKVFEKIFMVQYKKEEQKGNSDLTTSLSFLCEWSFASQFYELFYGEQLHCFSSGTQDVIKKVANHLKKIIHLLCCKEITVELLEIILKSKEKFLLLCATVGTQGEKSASSSVDGGMNMSNLIDQYYFYLKNFKQTKAICDLINHENAATLPHGDLQKKVRTDVKKQKVMDLVRVAENGEPNSTNFFEITYAELHEFMQISFVKGSEVFKQAIGNGSTSTHGDERDNRSWRYLLENWRNVKAQILSLIEEVDSAFLAAESAALEQTGNEMLNGEKRKQQIYNLFQSQQANMAINLLLELRDALSLNGDFSVLTARLELISNQASVLSMVPDNLEIPEICSLDEYNLKVLKSFLQEKSLREWLQEKMNDINEVKLMSDLGMISAGENVIEVDKVSRFLSAVVGFAPLVFCKEKDGKLINLKDLMEKCQQVWKNARSDDDLLKKWEATSEQLPWLKELEQFHGSVEKLSLTRAQEINARGIYTIERNTAENSLSVSKCVSLIIPGTNDDKSQQSLSLNELLDLQSKLMLIAGEAEKGKSDVNLFVEVLTAVQKLTQVFVKLLSSSCMLFENWSTIIECCANASDGKVGHLQIQTKFNKNCPVITGSGSSSDIDKLAAILNDSLESWDDHVSSVRMQYYHLNEYNIQQITYLCHELCRLKETGRFSVQARSLLTSVQSDFTDEELIDYLQKTFKTQSQDAVAEIADDVQDQDHLPDDSGTISDLKEKLMMVQKLVLEENCDENVAKAAVQENNCGDIVSCQLWILLNRDCQELVQNLSKQFDEFVAFNQEDMEVEVFEDVFRKQNTVSSFLHKLQTSDQHNLLDSTKTVCVGYQRGNIVLDLQDHMSIEQCGIFLENFIKEKSLDRRLMPAMHKGKPNLLVCSEEEILPTVLSIYMHSPEQPLPSRSEVLICSEETTADQAERFFRRAMCRCETSDQPLYCLAFAERLSFAVSSSIEKIFTDLMKTDQVDEDYQLVILLSQQQHYIATCFDKYLVDGKWNRPTKEIQDYLMKHLKAMERNEIAASVTNANFLVKVISSKRAGVGKSLYVKRLREEVENSNIESVAVTIRLLENKLGTDFVIQRLYKGIEDHQLEVPLLIHVDLTPAVQHGIEEFIFNLAILRTIQGTHGNVWSCHSNHIYMIEMTDLSFTGKDCFSSRHILNLLPGVKCYAPKELLSETEQTGLEKIGMDRTEFLSETFQRPYQYLLRYTNGEDLQSFSYTAPEGTPENCIEVLLQHCCMQNPSWAQLRHFCSFLNVQLQNCESSIFCNHPSIKQVLVGLKEFAVKFMIRMAQDFATPSLEISDCSMSDDSTENEFESHQIRRKWEESSHPFVFFNDDRETMTFINVLMNEDGHLLDQNGQITERNIANPQLCRGIILQGIKLSQRFDAVPRQEKLRVLYQVMGIKENRDENRNLYDPDSSYKLTTDNVLKIMAIYMRFRCQIPVIIMGETGCGKTRLVEFMSMLKEGRKPHVADLTPENMITLKIHGGISVEDIYNSVRKAKETEENRMMGAQSTILFYDEANTTEAIYAIKEVMCDKSINGESFENSNLQLVAACNPYKKLSDEAIKKLEDSGLGYRFHTSDTAHLFGNIPVRTLVYRVVALPPSMQPFVWDFGQLSDVAERVYIEQMTTKLAKDLQLGKKAISDINNVLSTSQRYMRSQRVECRYVSLRDVERCMTTYEWFYNHHDPLYGNIQNVVEDNYKQLLRNLPNVDKDVRTLLQTVGVCYHASLDEREPYRNEIAQCLDVPQVDKVYIKIELEACQSVFLRNTQMENNIACNEALKENVSMMAICADMQIPLFLIGKPGSSKSLAKTIITSNMQGPSSHAPLYQKLKQIHILSYQCSALTDAVGIKGVFNQCVQLQSKQDPTAYTAVVVLDEIGLAEDSPNMPLKVLHPLLERRSTDITTVSQSGKVGFVGISNWALDPAKMNRGIFLTRGKPTQTDLIETGQEIVGQSNWRSNQDLFEALTSAYLEIYENQEVEYFGLRDYYSLMKMISSCQKLSKVDERNELIAYSIIRNFSGSKRSVCEKFFKSITQVLQKLGEDVSSFQSSVSIEKIIKDNLSETDSRFLLLLANQFSVVHLLDLIIESFEKGAHVVFGSSFPGDHSYTEICININRIKVCMETGKTVILLNMNEIHESLYDALNQHYVSFGGQNYVDLGLGGHRVKCRINKDFRLIVIEKKDVVYEKYPIPLINRLEKHHFNSAGLLGEEKRLKVKQIKEWAAKFAKVGLFCERDAFIGFHEDTVSSVVLTSSHENQEDILLQSCALDAIFRLRNSALNPEEIAECQKQYLNHQCHDRLVDVLEKSIEGDKGISVLEITSYSSVLAKKDRLQLEEELRLPQNSIMLLSLEQFQTQQEYTNKLDQFFELCTNKGDLSHHMVLLVQCAHSQSSGSLISCAQHFLLNKLKDFKEQNLNTSKHFPVTIGFLLSTEREASDRSKRGDTLALQHTRESLIVYVDELRTKIDYIAPASYFLEKTLHEVFEAGSKELDGDDVEGLVDFRLLLKDCICESVAKVETSQNTERYFKLVEILEKLCIIDDTAGKYFRNTLVKKFVDMLSGKEELGSEIDWIVTEAMNRKNLKEGGTFRKTIWLCLKRYTIHMFASIISIIDKYNNLDVFAGEQVVTWKLNMWLRMFQYSKFTWPSQAKFSITYPTHLKLPLTCELPFSFIIIELFDSEWKALQKQGLKNIDEVFAGFKSLPFQGVVAEALDFAKKEVMQCFISDLVTTFYIPGTELQNEKKLIENVLFDFSFKNIKRARLSETFTHGDEIAVIYLTYKRLSKNFELFSKVLEACPSTLSLKSFDALVREQKEKDEFILLQEVFSEAIKFLKQFAETINESDNCCEWLNMMRQMKELYTPVINCIKTWDGVNEVKKTWESMSLLYLLLQQLLPLFSKRHVYQNYLKVVSPNAKLFWKGSVGGRRDPRSYDFLRIVLNVLQRCYSDIKLGLLIHWGDTTCKVCRRKVQKATVLPCHHYACENCIQNELVRASRQCPICSDVIPDDFTVQPAALDDIQKHELQRTKYNCTSFFLQYLEHFCFCDGQAMPLMERHIKQIVKGFIVQVHDEETMELDFSALDLNLNTKSVVLQILMNHSPNVVENEITHWLNQPNVDKQSLLTTLLKWFEQMVLSETSNLSNESDIIKHWEHVLGGAWRFILINIEIRPTLEVLKRVTEIRCSISYLTVCINDIMENVASAGDLGKSKEKFATFGRDLLMSTDMQVKDYFFKVGIHKFGSQWLHKLAKHEMFKLLIPPDLMQAVETSEVDIWTLLSPEYIESKSTLYRTEPQAIEEAIIKLIHDQSPEKYLPQILATLSWCDKKDPDTKQNVLSILERNIRENRSILLMLKSNEVLQSMLRDSFSTSQLSHVIYQLVILVLLAVSSKNNIMREFCKITVSATEANALFLPGMPEDLYFTFPVDYRTTTSGESALYECPKGHVYSITNCGRPYEEAKCPDCHEQIGGKMHKSAIGNKRIPVMIEQSQSGYRIHNAGSNMSGAEDRISFQGTAIVHFILHSCMIFGLQEDPAGILRMLNTDDISSAQRYLVQQLQKNVCALSKALSRNQDDSLLVLAKILLRITNLRDTNNYEDWSTLEKRRSWEQKFRTQYLLPVFQNLDAEISDAKNTLRDARNVESASLQRLMHDMHTTEELHEEFSWEYVLLWSVFDHPSLPRLLQVIEDGSDGQNTEVLNLILRSHDLYFVKHLEIILQFQQLLIKRFLYNIDLKEADQLTFINLITEYNFDAKTVDEYISAWNSVYERRRQVNPKELPVDLERLSRESPISMGLPSTRGRGQLAKDFAEYLINIQNNFLNESSRKIGSNIRIKEVATSELFHCDFVCVDIEKDLLPMVNRHTNYNIITTEHQRQHQMLYNIEALEKQVREKFVYSKKLILKKTLPLMKYPQDVGIGSDWEKVYATSDQKPLTAKLSQDVDRSVQRARSADVCEAVRTLTSAICFLAMATCESSLPLCDFLEKNLKLSSTRTSMIPRSAQICHILSLYQRMSWHKSVDFVRQGLDPYKEVVSAIEQEEIPGSIYEEINQAFKRMDVVHFQQRMNEMLINFPEAQGDWSLTKDVFPNLRFVDKTEDDQWFVKLPGAVCCKHISSLFALSVQFLQGNIKK